MEKSYREAFPDQFIEDEEDEEEEIVIIYIFDCNYIIYEIYVILLSFLNPQTYQIDSTIAIELFKEKELSIFESMEKISYIHSSYLSNYIVKEDANRK